MTNDATYVFDPKTYIADLESIAVVQIGKVVLEFSQLELNLNLSLQWIIHAPDFYTVNPLIERLSFKSKIDALIDIIEIKFTSNPECFSEFKSWHRKLDKLRVKRNSFVHGQWTFSHPRQKIINIAPGMNGSTKLKKTHYDVSELELVLLELKEVSNEFHALRDKWHF